MISLAVALRFACGLRLMRKRPELSVTFEPSTPMNEDRLSTSGSARITFASACWWSAIWSNEIASAAWVTPWMTPVSWMGKNPFGIVA